MSAPPEVTIVIPTRNRAKMLPTALAGALAQEDVELEVVVVDDGSTDETAARLASFADPRVVVVRHEIRRGLPHARNSGIASARGTWLAFLDDDDLWSPRKLRTQLDAAARNRAQFVYAEAAVLDADRTLIEVMPAPPPDSLLRLLLARNVVPAGSSNVLANADLVRGLGGFDETLPHLADWDLWIRMGIASRPAACEEVLLAYVHHSSNMLLVEQKGLVDELARLAVKHDSLSAAQGVTFDRVAFMRWIAWGERRAGRRLTAAKWYLRSAVRYRSGGDLIRALGTLAGEKLFTIARPAVPAPPTWLEKYMQDG